MEVKVAASAGFCFGVKRAVDLVYEETEKSQGRVYTMGPIIHNEQVVSDLEKRGVRIIGDDLIDPETGQLPSPESTIILRSHGVSRELTEKIKATGCKVANATCPFVKKIHDIVDKRSREGYHIVIIGSPVHPEVQGMGRRNLLDRRECRRH